MMTQAEILQKIEQCGVAAGNGPFGDGWNIMQNPQGAADFLFAMQRLGVKRVLELGTGAGGFARFMQIVMEWDVTSIDVAYPVPPVPYRFLQISSEAAVSLFHDDEFDLVFIDADGYQVRENHAWFAHTARIVAIHDIYSRDDTAPQPHFWREIAYQDDALKPGYYENPEWPGIGWYIREITQGKSE